MDEFAEDYRRGPPPGRYDRYDDRRRGGYGGRHDDSYGYRGSSGRYDDRDRYQGRRDLQRDEHAPRGIDRYASSGRDDRYSSRGDDRRGGYYERESRPGHTAAPGSYGEHSGGSGGRVYEERSDDRYSRR